MTKDQKRIKALEKEVEELRKTVLELAARPQYVYIPVNPQPVYTQPVFPYQPTYPWMTTCGSAGNVTMASNDLMRDIRVYN